MTVLNEFVEVDYLTEARSRVTDQFKDKVVWLKISAYQKLSESFIRKFKNKVNWDFISKYQKLSENFKEKFKHKLNVV